MESAKNDEALCRRMNDDRRVRFGDRARLLALLCECGEPSCRRTVLLTAQEYDSLRPGLVLHSAHAQ